MKRILTLLSALALAIGMLVPGVVLANGEGTEICVENLPAEGGVTGGNNDYCSNEVEEWDEWHFIINQLNPATEAGAPQYIIATFQTASEVQIDLEKIAGGAAHYRTKGVYLTDTLLDACGILPEGSTYGNFVLSHAPCSEENGNGGGEHEIEVGGEVYPVNKGTMMTPAIAAGVLLLSGAGWFIWRRQTVK